MDKKQMRMNIKAQLSALEKPEYEQRCYFLTQHLYTLPEWRKSNIVALTISTSFEVDTWSVIRQAWTEGKKVCVPKCIPATKEMHFYFINDFRRLEQIYAGLYEPHPAKEAFVSSDQIDLVIVPGLLFNKRGYRIGFGGGYYDRFLPGFLGTAISLAFELQLSEDVPVEPHDIAVQKIVTDKGVVNCFN